MRNIYCLTALVSFAFAFVQPVLAQGYDPNQQQYSQGGYQQPPTYQQYGGLPQTTPNYGYGAPDQGQYQQQGYQQQPGYGQQQMQQQQPQYGQMPQAPVYYGQAQQTTQGQWQGNNNQQPQQSNQMPAGSFLNNDPPPGDNTPDKTVTENPGGNGHGGAVIKGAAGLLGKFVGGTAKVAAPAASLYLMNKAVGGNMRMYVPAPVMPIPGMGGYGGYNPYMGTGMRSMMGGW
jgi:hypothetical protein